MNDRLEFYVEKVSNGCIAQVDSSHAPQVGEHVSIKGQFYTVSFRAWSLDWSGKAHASMCGTIILKPAALTGETGGAL